MKLNKLNIAIVGLSGMLSAPAFAQNFYQCMPVGCQKGEYGKPGFCNPCEQGTYSDTINATACTKCPPGSYNTGGGSSMCEFCPAGQYQENYGGGCCDYCKSGTYSLQGATKCYANREYVGFGGGSGWYDENIISIRVGLGAQLFATNPLFTEWHFYDANCYSKSNTDSKPGIIYWGEQQQLFDRSLLIPIQQLSNPLGQEYIGVVEARKTSKGTEVRFAKESACQPKLDTNEGTTNCNSYTNETHLVIKNDKELQVNNQTFLGCLQCAVSSTYIVDNVEIKCK